MFMCIYLYYVYIMCIYVYIMYHTLCLNSSEKKNGVVSKEKDFAGCCSKK